MSEITAQILTGTLPAEATPPRERVPAGLSRQELSDWFGAEVRPHESSLRAYLKARFPTVADLDDLVQEALSRVAQMRQRGPVASAKSLLFTVARNLAFSQLRREQVISFEGMGNLDGLRVLVDAPDAAESASTAQEIELLQEALRHLPHRCRQVLTLRMVYGLKSREIADRLGIAEHTVCNQMTIGFERCRQFLSARGVTGAPRP